MFIVAFGKELHKRGELIKELAFFFSNWNKRKYGKSSRIERDNCFSTTTVKINLRNKTIKIRPGERITSRAIILRVNSCEWNRASQTNKQKSYYRYSTKKYFHLDRRIQGKCAKSVVLPLKSNRLKVMQFQLSEKRDQDEKANIKNLGTMY